MLATSVACSAFAQNNSSKASDVLVVALPTYAAASYQTTSSVWLQLIQSEAVMLGVVEVLKASTHKTRPDGSDNKSFPSGHAAGSTAPPPTPAFSGLIIALVLSIVFLVREH